MSYNNYNSSYRNNYNNYNYNNNQDRGYQNRNNSYAQTNNNSVPLKEPYYSQVLSKVKTVEGRINSGQFRNIEIGQKITFTNQHTKASQKEACCKIVGKRVYKSFDEMLKQEGLKKCLPDAKTLDEGIRIYNNLPGFRERAERSGVVALEISLIENKKLEIKDSKDLRDKIEVKRTRDQDEKIANEDERSFKKQKTETLKNNSTVTLPKINVTKKSESKILSLDDLGCISKKNYSKDKNDSK